MATETIVEVVEESVNVNVEDTPGMASRIAVIGAFNSTVTDVTAVQTTTAAHAVFGTTETLGDFKGTDDIDFLFLGASELIVANITTWSDDETPVASTSLTNEKLNAALAKLSHEEFDIFFVADELSDAQQTIVTTWLANEFKDKFCHGQVAQLQKSGSGAAAAYTASAATFGKNEYYINTQNIGWYGTVLNLNQSAALMAGLIAAKQVNESLTAKLIEGITSVSPEYLTDAGELGAKLLELNIPFIKARTRNRNYVCVNSMMPNGLDMSINRTRDYVINRLQAELLLGESSSDMTLSTATMYAEDVREECVSRLKLLKDIIYHVEKISSTEVDIVLDKLIFDGIITKVKIRYTIEVQ